MKIAVDAMGGDYAPEAIVEGAIQAAEEYDYPLILVGQEDRVHAELAKYKTDHLAIEVRHASQVVDMHDLPSFALRRKKDSSLHVAINLIKKGEADAAVSAGNTGAAMAIGKVACRMLEGIERPALATVVPNIDGATVIIDVGANVDCKPLQLLQFAVMGHVYAREVIGVAMPRIGLLSIGEEDTKGNILTKEVFEPLSNSKLNFIGNAEGRDVFNARVDVLVCDGFTGNVVLKVSESLAKTIGIFLKEGFSKNWRTKLGYLLVKPEMDAMKRRIDYSEYGGAPLLGLNGVVIVSHGSSKARAIKNAIRVAAESVNHHLNDQIIETLINCEFDKKSRAKATSLWRQFKDSILHESDKGKSTTEKKEEPPSKEEVQPTASSSEPDLKQEGQESAKKAWWQLKDLAHRNEHDKEVVSVEETEVPEQPEQTQEPEQPEQKHEDIETSQEELEHEKKSWWYLKRNNEKDSSSSDKEKILEEQPQEVKPELPPDIEHNQEQKISTSKDPESEKTFWGKIKDLTHSESDNGKSPSEKPLETEPETQEQKIEPEPIEEPESSEKQSSEEQVPEDKHEQDSTSKEKKRFKKKKSS